MPGFGCQVCDVSLNSQEQLQQHRTGRKHLNKVKETGVGLAIEKEKSGYGAEPSKLYGTFVSSSEKKTEPEKPPAISLNVNEFENKPLFVFNAESQERQHYTGKRHVKRMRMVAIEEKAGETIQSVLQSNGFSCQFCDMVLNSLEQLEHHRIGTKHQKKVAAATGKPIEKEEQASKSSSPDA